MKGWLRTCAFAFIFSSIWLLKAGASEMDLRLNTNAKAFQEFLGDPESDPWQFLFFDNPKMDDHGKWGEIDSADFKLLNPDQQLFVLGGDADGEIQNGGVGQLFFNKGGYVPQMESAFAGMGCTEAAELLGKEIERLSHTSFMADWAAAQQQFTANNQSGDKEAAWEKYSELMEKYFPENDGGDDSSQAYYDLRDNTLACIRRYIARHADSFVAISK